jgi:hypothetical protein
MASKTPGRSPPPSVVAPVRARKSEGDKKDDEPQQDEAGRRAAAIITASVSVISAAAEEQKQDDVPKNEPPHPMISGFCSWRTPATERLFHRTLEAHRSRMRDIGTTSLRPASKGHTQPIAKRRPES